MSQDSDEVLAPAARPRDLSCMRCPNADRQTTALQLLALLACSALSLIAAGVDVHAVKEVLTIVFPPIVALAASEKRGS